ncbi:CGNR zinc finger domain-containing protein [Brevibacterium celere]|uniref:CGNR zinc finger domain-containing protein n=1 Tax=Brevibacterium celere TaxID=225845 RepID=UPI0031D57AB7
MDFEHVGNAHCFELVNSVPNRQDGGDRDWLCDVDTAEAWAQTLGLGPVQRLTRDELASLRSLREKIHAVFTAVVNGVDIPVAELNAVTEAHAAGLSRYGYAPTSAGIARAWPAVWDAESLTALFAESALEELNGPRLDRVKSCPNCRWLFVDTSRNRSRRWCSMRTCGGRDKALRHYRKTSG